MEGEQRTTIARDAEIEANATGNVLFFLLSGMLILVLVIKDFLRTYFSPCPCGSGRCPYPGSCGLVLVLVLVVSL